MTQNKYSDLKLLHFPRKLESFRSGIITPPIYVRVKPINVCNHHCYWCLHGDTWVTMGDSSLLPISKIVVGDTVMGSTQRPNKVVSTGHRTVNEWLEIHCGDRVICTSHEHPFLTTHGWVDADKLTLDTRLVMTTRHACNDIDHQVAKIDKITPHASQLDVFNFSCEPDQAYIANDFIVHNCVYHVPDASQMHKEMAVKDRIPKAKLLELLDDFSVMGVKAVTYSGGGEPLIYPDIDEIMARTLELGIHLSCITNGSRLTGRTAELLGNAKWVRVSMDYSSPKQLSQFRGTQGNEYWSIMDNLREFAQSKQLNCDLYVNFIVHKDNHSELFEVANKLKCIGVQNVRFSPMWVAPGFHDYHAQIEGSVMAQLSEIKDKLVSETFSVNSTYDTDSPVHSTVRPYHRCFFAQVVPVVGADQRVYACHNKAYDSSGVIGSIADKSFKELWESEEARRALEEIDPSIHCKHQCAAEHKNRLITEYMATSFDAFV